MQWNNGTLFQMSMIFVTFKIISPNPKKYFVCLFVYFVPKRKQTELCIPTICSCWCLYAVYVCCVCISQFCSNQIEIYCIYNVDSIFVNLLWCWLLCMLVFQKEAHPFDGNPLIKFTLRRRSDIAKRIRATKTRRKKNNNNWQYSLNNEHRNLVAMGNTNNIFFRKICWYTYTKE